MGNLQRAILRSKSLEWKSKKKSWKKSNYRRDDDETNSTVGAGRTPKTRVLSPAEWRDFCAGGNASARRRYPSLFVVVTYSQPPISPLHLLQCRGINNERCRIVCTHCIHNARKNCSHKKPNSGRTSIVKNPTKTSLFDCYRQVKRIKYTEIRIDFHRDS